MARIRSIKPEAFTSETLAARSVHARWTFAGLWCYVDDDARGLANPGLIKAAVWPLDDDISVAEVGRFLDELEGARLICRYEVDGKRYLHVVNFGEHQHPNRPLASKLPACSRRTHGGLTEPAVSTHPGGSAAGSGAPAASPEATTAKNTGQSDVSAGQGSLTEDSVSAHGGVKPKSSSTPPTPLRNEQGEGGGVGDGDEVPPTAVAAQKRATTTRKPRQPSNNAGDVIAAFVDGALAANLTRPPEESRNRVGKAAKSLLAQGYPLEKVIETGRNCGAAGHDNLVAQWRKDDKTASNGTGGKQTNYTDEEYARGWQ